MKKLLLKWLLGFGLLLLPRTTQALSLPTPQPTAAIVSQVPQHIKTYVQLEFSLNSCYHVSGANSFNGACNGAPGGVPTPSASGSYGDWQTLANYITYTETNLSGMDVIASSGVKTVAYLDAALPHGILDFDPGMGPSTKGFSFNNVCANAYPIGIQLITSYYGLGVYLPSTNVSSCNGNYYGSIMGDVRPASVSLWEQYIENGFYQMPMSALGGYSGAVPEGSWNGLSAIRFDDMEYPAARFTNQLVCIDTPSSLGTSSAGSTVTSCSDGRLSGGPTATYSSHRYFHLHPYPDYMDHNWISGTQNLFRMPKKLGLETIFNDAYDPLKWPYYATFDHSNVYWVECEGCITKNGYASNAPWSEVLWSNHINTEISAQELGIGYHAFNPTETSTQDVINLYASLALGQVDPNLTMTTENFTGSLGTPNSQIDISPMIYLVPTQPINRPAAFYFNPMTVGYNPMASSVNLSYGIGTLKQSGGAYLQEFNACYNGSSVVGTANPPVAIGPCAMIVNPTGSTVLMPTTVNTYHHTATFTGAGVITPTQFGGGDTGALSVTAAAAPSAGQNLSAYTSYIETQ